MLLDLERTSSLSGLYKNSRFVVSFRAETLHYIEGSSVTEVDHMDG